jgi:hypothetical protein
VSRDPAARAARLLRWYPRPWRDRYGAEFAELLISDIEERPRSAGRAADVARGGLTARLAGAGLAGGPRPAPGAAVTPQQRYQQVSASLGSLLGVLAVFLVAALALASALVIYWQFPVAGPGPAALTATRVISGALLILLALAVTAVLPVLGVLVARLGGRQAIRRGLRGPAVVLLSSIAFLITGGRHFGNGWPGTGGHGSFVPAGLAAFEWASSLFVSAYWAHPGALAAFPPAEVGWMAVSPLALAAAVAAATVLVRRAGLPPWLLAFEVRLATAACAVLLAVFAAAAGWVASSGRGQSVHAGLVDLACTTVLAAALPFALQAVRAARRELRLARISA